MLEPQVDASELAAVLQSLTDCVGHENIELELEEREYYSQDYYRKGLTALAVVKPMTIEQLSQAVALATQAGVAVFPRGGGLSYSDGYLPTRTQSIIMDTAALDRIVEINEQDMYVTVETGCTWAALESALSSTSVRPGFWGTLSGLHATIGGTISQGGASLGSAKYGTSSESVLAVSVVTADGSIVRTGSAGQENKTPFFRYYGPDMTGVFCSDCGALGIKATITLRLERRRQLHYGLSFGYHSFEGMVQGIAAVAREGRATEQLSFSAETMANFGELSFTETLKTAYKVASTSSNPVNGLIQVVKMGFAGKRFLDKTRYMSHCVIEAGNQKELNGQIALIREVVKPYGFDLPNTVPTVIRAMPFPPPDTLAPNGQRLLPIHTILPLSKVVEFHLKLGEYLDGHKERLVELGITQQPILGSMGTNGFLYEPVFYWRDQPQEYHQRNTSPEVLSNASNTDNVEARELLEVIRVDVIELMHQCGGVHMQVGKMFPFMQDRSPESMSLMMAIKQELDPHCLMNPGALRFCEKEKKFTESND